MDDPEEDARKADIQFLQMREAEHRQALKETETLMGRPINVDTIGEVLEGVLESLRIAGNPDLAEKYRSAFDRNEAATKAVTDDITKGTVDDHKIDVMKDALEDFERIQAEASAWFDLLDEKGGA